MPAVSVVVAARDAEGLIGRTLAALATQDVENPYEVIVVDNGSRDRTAAVAEGFAVTSKVLRRERGEGPGAARNAGAAAAAGHLLAFTDADCEPAPGWLRAGLRAARDADLVQGTIGPPPGVPIRPFDRTFWRPHLSALHETANMFVKRELFERVGGFPAGLEDAVGGDLDAPFGEDVLFGWAAARAGARVAFCDDAVVHHAVLPRGPRAFVAERRRLAHFPRLVAEVPELRDHLFWRRWFLSPRTAAFDVGVVCAAICRRVPIAALGLLPYALMCARRSPRPALRSRPLVALVDLAADLVGLVALIRGSAAARSPVL